jgi:enolase
MENTNENHEKRVINRLSKKSLTAGYDENEPAYSAAALKRASLYIRILALSHNESEQKIREEISNAIDVAMNNTAPEVREHWNSFHYSGETPTPEEFLLWAYDLYSATDIIL